MKSKSAELEFEIRKIIAKIIEVDPQKITPDAHFIEDLGSDSMMVLEMMAALEKKFGITIPEEQLVNIASLRQVTKLVSDLLPTRK